MQNCRDVVVYSGETVEGVTDCETVIAKVIDDDATSLAARVSGLLGKQIQQQARAGGGERGEGDDGSNDQRKA